MKALLIGNDINNATADYSWSNLLKDLIAFAKLRDIPNMGGKPFPLLYEEIFLNSSRQHGIREKKLKNYLARQAARLQPNVLHRQIMALEIQNILTTNYDLTLEIVLNRAEKTVYNAAVKKESLYSLYRFHQCPDHRIWHIHGTLVNPSSITLGYEHYSGYLQQMRNYAVSTTRNSSQATSSLLQRLKQGQVTHESWMDFFFTHDVHILGINLDFVEIHLWWLLTFRARARLLNRAEINNTIFYYYPQSYEQRSQQKLELLRANDVHTVPLTMKGANRIGYYERVLERVGKSSD
jgi:SIR2-like domain